MTQSGGGWGGGAEKHFFSVTLYNFQKCVCVCVGEGGWGVGGSPSASPGLKTEFTKCLFRSEIGSRFEGVGSTPPPKLYISTPPPD